MRKCSFLWFEKHVTRKQFQTVVLVQRIDPQTSEADAGKASQR